MFTHLHIRSCYTMLGSTLKMNDIIQMAKEQHLDTLVLTDKHVMHGAMNFYHACKKAQIKPVFGLEVSVNLEDKIYNFICYAKNDLSFTSMLKLSTRLNTLDELLSFDEFIPYTKEMIVVSAMDNDELENMIIKEDREQMSAFFTLCRDNFFDYYVAVSKNDSGLFQVKNVVLKNIAQSLGISTVAISRVYYARKEDEFAYKVLCAMKQGVLVNDNMLQYSANRYFRSYEEMKEIYDEEDLETVSEIIAKCHVTMSFEKSKLPSFENKFHVDSSYYLQKLCEKGLEKRMNFQSIPMQYKQRLNYELDIISQMGFSDYFLIVWDFIKYARSQDIYVGPGRGSAAGSLVAYCLGITHVDPIRYDLLFERFLNPERISMPDIDTDFPDNRRDEVIRYVHEKYGDHKVAHIVTFGTLAAKQVLRDVGKAMNVPLREIDSLCKLVPNVLKITLSGAYEQSPPFKQRIVKSRQLQEVYNIALKLEGLPRHSSIHAGGIVISGKDIETVCPLMKVDGEMFATQYTMEYLEELGLIKMDFLGLRNLTIIDEIVKRVEYRTGKKLDILKIPMNDSRTYSLIAEADTVGVFQLESEGMKSLLKKIRPKCFEDIVACIALFRPGPMENIPDYIFYRENPQNIQYPHDSLKPILNHTYGIMIYQEQIIQIAQKMAGFSLGKADILRKAISKKKEKELAGLQKDFIEGSIQNGYSKETAQKVYDLIMKFANYGFNRAHSVAYGFLAYQMAYLKANFPLEFFASVLNNVIHSESKTAEYIYEAKKRNIHILSPSVNFSGKEYLIEAKGLRYPLMAIKNVGTIQGNEILNERKQHGKYRDYFDFIARMSSCKINRKVIESLIYAGALDEFGMNRATLIQGIDDALRYGDLVKIEDENQILFNFDLVSKPVLTQMRESIEIRCMKEKEVLGFYLSAHPLTNLRNKIAPDLKTIYDILKINGRVQFLCHVDRIRQHRTKTAELMLFAGVSDETASIDLAVMPKTYQKYHEILLRGNYLIVEGKKDKDNSVLVYDVKQVNLS